MEKESNSHYHAHMKCLKIVDSSFNNDHLVIPEDLVAKFTVYQKFYLSTCLQVPRACRKDQSNVKIILLELTLLHLWSFNYP